MHSTRFGHEKPGIFVHCSNVGIFWSLRRLCVKEIFSNHFSSNFCDCDSVNKKTRFWGGLRHVLGEIVIDNVSLYWVEERKPSSNVSHICYYTVYTHVFPYFLAGDENFGGCQFKKRKYEQKLPSHWKSIRSPQSSHSSHTWHQSTTTANQELREVLQMDGFNPWEKKNVRSTCLK